MIFSQPPFLRRLIISTPSAGHRLRCATRRQRKCRFNKARSIYKKADYYADTPRSILRARAGYAIDVASGTRGPAIETTHHYGYAAARDYHAAAARASITHFPLPQI